MELSKDWDRAALTQEIEALVGAAHVFVAADELAAYATDETHERRYLPDLVVRPGTVTEIAAIAALCHRRQIPLTTRGGGSGVSGGALAVRGGVVLLMERLNRILSLSRADMTVKVEAGIITGELQDRLAAEGLCLPPDPGSRAWCQIGGNLASAAAGPKSVKYGGFRDYVLNLEVVLADGTILETGADVRKISCGYDLTRLMVGSEGTLGIITAAVFRLIPAPTEALLLRLAMPSLHAAGDLICKIFEAGLEPAEVELMEAGAIAVTRPFVDEPISAEVTAFLWVGFDGQNEATLLEDAERLNELAEEMGATEVLLATEPAQINRLWTWRHKVGEAIIETTPFLDIDVSFPRSRLAEMLEGARRIGTRFGFELVAFGHAGDGNLHVQILRKNLDDAAWQGAVRQGIGEIYALVVSLGGALSGEHGIGCTLTPYLPTMFSTTHLALMRGLKAVFDPKGILNPGKILP